MNMYRVLGDRAGTSDARELAERLVSWHDAMVKHLRIIGARPYETCADGCPHEEASVLWSAAHSAFGPSVSQLEFLRSHAEGRWVSAVGGVSDQAIESRA
jgi:hypothetical protein